MRHMAIFICEAESEGDSEASFVHALLGGGSFGFLLAARFALVLAALDLLLESASWLEEAGAIEVPNPRP
jgi:hypothetical protein